MRLTSSFSRPSSHAGFSTCQSGHVENWDFFQPDPWLKSTVKKSHDGTKHLVGGSATPPLWKRLEFVNDGMMIATQYFWENKIDVPTKDDEIPNISRKINKNGNQTTNQTCLYGSIRPIPSCWNPQWQYWNPAMWAVPAERHNPIRLEIHAVEERRHAVTKIQMTSIFSETLPYS